MRDFRLSPQAEQTLEEIIGWTIDHFGAEYTVRYKDKLVSCLSALVAVDVPHGRPGNILLAGNRTALDLEYYREGRHFIV